MLNLWRSHVLGTLQWKEPKIAILTLIVYKQKYGMSEWVDVYIICMIFFVIETTVFLTFLLYPTGCFWWDNVFPISLEFC